MISGRDPSYPREAREAKVSGTMIVRCTITTAGSLTGCRVLKGLPFMDGPVLSAMAARRYTPVLLRGKPVNVDYTFNIKVVAP